ncbi:hypothetical protein IMSAGC003_02870 [Lachnospiraceae bacterium]|nr:hypothetical protein [Acetatifactor sp.]GFH96315.1 hypothetical protein IMSAGC003_02870 [Lachnospiraceae bacterium]
MWKMITELFQGFMGTGLIMGWYLLALVYLWFVEKDRRRRVLLVYAPLAVLALYFNPLFARLVYGAVGDEIYYRILWLLPVTIVVAYATADLYGRLRGRKKYGFAVLSAVLVMISGSCIYASPHFHKAENLYHMPQAVVDICDAIQVEGREVMAVFPKEMLSFVRQYTPLVCMPYGREMLVERWQADNPLYDAMEAPVLDLDVILPLAKTYSSHFVILPEGKKTTGHAEDYGFVLVNRMDGYVIYQDTGVYIGL